MLFAASTLALSACKKNNTQPTPTPTPTPTPVTPTPVTPTNATRQQLTLDSIFLYAKEIYYWNDRLPSYDVFNPRQYTSAASNAASYTAALNAIARYSNPFEWTSTSTSPKYSYIFDKVNKNPVALINPVSSVDLEGNGNDLGIRFGLYGSENDYAIYVTAVYQNSPAEAQGFVRGDLVKKINGQSFGTNYSGEVGALNNALNGTSVTLEGIKADGTTSFNKSVTKGVFKSSPIYKTKVITAGAKKIGYLAYARFSNKENSETALSNAFSTFSSSGVTDLVIDLRYNGGGYISTAEHLINLIAPSTASGTMFTEYYNSTMKNNQAVILQNQPLLDGNGKVQYFNNQIVNYYNYRSNPYSEANNTSYFSKKGSLNSVRNIVFLVSSSTASASELVINSLKPHMNVKLVGRTTYGKPIGFFPVTIENKYDIYFSMFETKNSAGDGGYFSGMVPDFSLYELTEIRNPSGTLTGYTMVDFGDVNDTYLKKALDILAPGVTVTNDRTTMSTSSVKTTSKNIVSSSNVINAEFADKEFKGMVENRFRLRN